MLKITVPGEEFFDETLQEFNTVGDVVLELEHSLVSLSKWESKWEEPFLGPQEKSTEKTLDYIRCMILTADYPPDTLNNLSDENMRQINAYLESKQSATWFSDDPSAPKSREIITSELIYYWLTVFNIPFEVETWNLNRLFTLIKISNVKNAKPKKMSRAEMADRNRRLNAERKAKLKTSG